MLSMFLSLAFAAPPPDIEIIVYEDDFARWDNTRWHIVSELVLPIPGWFAADKNKAFQAAASQLRAVIQCDKQGKISKKKWEVKCVIEDIAIDVFAHNRWKTAKSRALVDEVIQELDAKMTGAELILQVDSKGGVNNVALGGWETTNTDQRQSQEEMRQLWLRALAGFHQKIPDHAQAKGQWPEYNSELMRIPSLSASRGSSTIVHTVSRYKGNPLVQSLGEGFVSVQIPNPQAFAFTAPEIQGLDVDVPQGDGAPPTSSGAAAPEATPSNKGASSGFTADFLEAEGKFKIIHKGVSVYNIDTGIMAERVWSTFCEPTASSAIQLAQFIHYGKIRQLSETEKVDVGLSKQIMPPGGATEFLPALKSIYNEVVR